MFLIFLHHKNSHNVIRKKNLTIYFFQMKRSGEPLRNKKSLSLTKISKLRPFITKQADNLSLMKK